MLQNPCASAAMRLTGFNHAGRKETLCYAAAFHMQLCSCCNRHPPGPHWVRLQRPGTALRQRPAAVLLPGRRLVPACPSPPVTIVAKFVCADRQKQQHRCWSFSASMHVRCRLCAGWSPPTTQSCDPTVHEPRLVLQQPGNPSKQAQRSDEIQPEQAAGPAHLVPAHCSLEQLPHPGLF